MMCFNYKSYAQNYMDLDLLVHMGMKGDFVR